jgi:hypothetical protein
LIIWCERNAGYCCKPVPPHSCIALPTTTTAFRSSYPPSQTRATIADTIHYGRYTSYVGCTVLLYGTTQRILQGAREDVGLELAYASSHIAILSICSYENEVARKMYTSLQILFNDVRDVLTVPVHATGMHGGSSMGAPAPMMLTQGQVVQTPDDVRRTVVDVARQIVDILENSINF